MLEIFVSDFLTGERGCFSTIVVILIYIITTFLLSILFKNLDSFDICIIATIPALGYPLIIKLCRYFMSKRKK